MARTEYGGLRVWPSTISAPGLPTTQLSTPIRTEIPVPGALDLHRLGAGGTQFVDHVEHGFGRHPGAVSSMVKVTPGPVAGTVPIRIDSAASRAWAFWIAAWSLLPAVCIESRVRCSSATSVFSAASRCCSEPSRTSRSAGRAVSSASPDSVLPDLGDDADAEHQAQQHAQDAEHQLGAASRPRDPGRRPNLLHRFVGRQFVAAVLDRLVLSRVSGCRRSPHAPNSLRRSAAALPKMRMPSTTMIAVDSWVPTPSWSPT